MNAADPASVLFGHHGSGNLASHGDEDEDRWGYGWRCYCGVPEQSFRPDGTPGRPHFGQVYLVFVNDDKVAYNWRWEKADPDNLDLPMDHQARFKQRLR